MSGSIKPFRINIDQAKIDRLKQKLALTDLPPPEVDGDAPWARGVPLAEQQRLLKYWIEEYDWRKTEAKLNDTLPQFTTDIDIDGFDTYSVHFVHQKSKVETAIPLLFLHGWPGNFTEVDKILPLLVSGDGKDVPSFHVVAPSLINFGFSDRCRKSGFGLLQHAETGHKLMQKLGYEKYVVQGGDLGSFVARIMVQHYQTSIGGHLLNLCPITPGAKTRSPKIWAKIMDIPLSEDDKRGQQRSEYVQKEMMGYHRQQSTKPQTLGYSMADSPAGLLAWVYEKLHEWSDNYPWSEEEVLQWVCIYYFSTAGPNATQQIYYDSAHISLSPLFDDYSPVPLGVARFPHELQLPPKAWHEMLGPVVHWGQHNKGGHFAATEAPGELVQDLRAMFGRGGGAEGCCGERRTGYIDGKS